MEKLTVKIEKVLTGYKAGQRATYKILSVGNFGYPEGFHLKTTQAQYVVALIEEYGFIFYDRKTKAFTALEKAELAQHHYRHISMAIFTAAGQRRMAESLEKATVTHRKIDYDLGEKFYSVIFSNKLQVRVSDLYWRMFDIKPLLNSSVMVVQKSLTI